MVDLFVVLAKKEYLCRDYIEGCSHGVMLNEVKHLYAAVRSVWRFFDSLRMTL